MEKSKFYLRLIKAGKVLYESPENGDDINIRNENNPTMVAEDFVNAINNSNFLGSKNIKAILVNNEK